jgi:hypothetical protein
MLAEDIKHTFNTWSLLYTIICINPSKKNTGCSTHASFCLFAFLQNVLNARHEISPSFRQDGLSTCTAGMIAHWYWISIHKVYASLIFSSLSKLFGIDQKLQQLEHVMIF